MKKIITLFLACLVLSCSEDFEVNNELLNNLFNDVTVNGERTFTKFSEKLNQLEIFESIEVEEVVLNQFTFKINTLTEVYLNGVYVDLASKTYTIKRSNEMYLITDNSLDGFLGIVNSEVFYETKGGLSERLAISRNENIEVELERNFPIYSLLLREFTQENTQKGTSSNLNSLRTSVDWCRTAVGIGFHWNKSDADFFCEEDYNSILEEHPDWMSTGISTSCVTDEHFCFCNAYFYEECEEEL